jgi:hypothetical protein
VPGTSACTARVAAVEHSLQQKRKAADTLHTPTYFRIQRNDYLYNYLEMFTSIRRLLSHVPVVHSGLAKCFTVGSCLPEALCACRLVLMWNGNSEAKLLLPA